MKRHVSLLKRFSTPLVWLVGAGALLAGLSLARNSGEASSVEPTTGVQGKHVVKSFGKTLQISREQSSEPMMSALEQLNSDRLSVRLRGIKALEGLANVSREDRWEVMETLTAYIRKHASWDLEAAQPEKAPGSENSTTHKCPMTMKSSQEISPTPEDIQAILTIIGEHVAPSNN